MAELSTQSAKLQYWIERLQAGDDGALNALLNHAYERLLHLAHRMLRAYPSVKNWEQTDDVLQNALIRLTRALKQVPLTSVAQFVGLATLQIRRELIDLARRYSGQERPALGQGVNVDNSDACKEARTPAEKSETTDDPLRLAEWAEFHERASVLPDDERAVFELLWYHEMSQAEAAEILKVSEKTVNRLWRTARLRIKEAMDGGPFDR